MSALAVPLRRAFLPLSVPNFRRFVLGQLVSLSGTWMQTVAEMWLVLTLTGSGVALGLATALQFTPMLLIGAWGGLLADRFSRRRLLLFTQSGMALPAIALFAVTATGHVELWMVYAEILARGAMNAIDNPTRQSFFFELVGPELVSGAIALNSAMINGARIFGPALGGVLIATVGVTPCFGLNALSFAAVVVALLRMDPAALHGGTRVPRAAGQLRAGLAYVWRTPELRLPLALMLVVSMLAYNFTILLPLMAREFGGGGGSYGALTATMGIGSVFGAIATASRNRPTMRLLLGSSFVFGVLVLAAAAAPALDLELAVLLPLGAASIAYAATTNAALQLAVEPEMRGRVMALYSVVFLGSTPLGAPLVGWIASVAGARAGLLVGGAATLVATAAACVSAARRTRSRPRSRPGPRTRDTSASPGRLRA